MKMRRFLNIVLTAACAASLCGCLHGKGGDTRYVIKPVHSDGSQTSYPDYYVSAYAYYADTTQWRVASYDDALAGRITAKNGGQVRNEPDAIAEPYFGEALSDKYCVEMTLKSTPVMLIVADPVLRIYGYRQQTLAEGLSSLFESVTFYTSRNGKTYKSGQWVMCNDFYGLPGTGGNPDDDIQQPGDTDDNGDPDNDDAGDQSGNQDGDSEESGDPEAGGGSDSAEQEGEDAAGEDKNQMR